MLGSRRCILHRNLILLVQLKTKVFCIQFYILIFQKNAWFCNYLTVRLIVRSYLQLFYTYYQKLFVCLCDLIAVDLLTTYRMDFTVPAFIIKMESKEVVYVSVGLLMQVISINLSIVFSCFLQLYCLDMFQLFLFYSQVNVA